MTPVEKANDPLSGLRCQGTSKQSGARCKRRPIPGGTVCVMHGGKTPSVQARARQRLEDLLPLALRAMKRNVKQRTDPGVAQRAAESIVKLNDLEPVQKVDANVSYRWREPGEPDPGDPQTEG